MALVGQIFGPQIGPKKVNIEVFVYFLETFLLYSLETWFTSSLELLFYVCKRGAPEAQILGHFGPPNESKLRFSNILLKSLLWIHTSLALYAHWSYFQRCVKYEPQRTNFWAILGSKVRKISGVWSLSQKVFTGFTTVLPHILIPSTFRCVENMGLRGPIFGPLWAPK